MSEPIVFFGNERLATGVTTTAPVLRMLIDEGYSVKAVITQYERGKSRNVRDLEIAAVADAQGIPVLMPGKLTDAVDEIRALAASTGVLVAYGKIIPQSVIDLFPNGIINIHPSALPKHRGPTPLESVILDGSHQTTVSLMQLVKAMDAGPIFAQTPIELTGAESKQQLYDTVAEASASTLKQVLPMILNGTCTAVPQDESQATYDRLITKDDGLLDWQKPAAVLEREIRAYAEWPKSRTTLAGKDVVITKAHVVTKAHLAQQTTTSDDHSDAHMAPGTAFTDRKQLCIQTSDGVLVIDTLKPAGKAEMSGQAFLAGHARLLA